MAYTLGWRRVAQELAARLGHHAYCIDHNREEEDLDNCPFCRDRWAYDLYQMAVTDHEAQQGRRAWERFMRELRNGQLQLPAK